ncbi:L-lactate dehydrogenase A chain-like [Narcine bancroftii]|uniref:L-lactate dehydrogenase A chain-like n=1 Tax=Narcine bancroftii TaxID=1343680 RepID=UPI00383211C4
MDVRHNLMKEVSPSVSVKPSFKITIVGAGKVGMSCAFCLLQKNLADELVLVDKLADLVKGEAMDLLHGSLFLKSRITADTDYKVTQDSKVCIVCAGMQVKGERADTNQLQNNIAAFKEIIPQLAKYSPAAILLIVTQPVDLLTYVAWKLSGFPKNRVIGTGTNLDNARFRYLLGTELNINPENVHAYIVGEQGCGSIPIWGGTNVAGINVKDLDEKLSSEHGHEIHRRVIESGQEVVRLKGSISWAIGLSVTNILNAILKNLRCIHLVSTNAKDQHDIKSDVFLSLPCILGSPGVCGIVRQPLEEEEERKLRCGVEKLLKAQQEVVL